MLPRAERNTTLDRLSDNRRHRDVNASVAGCHPPLRAPLPGRR